MTVHVVSTGINEHDVLTELVAWNVANGTPRHNGVANLVREAALAEDWMMFAARDTMGRVLGTADAVITAVFGPDQPQLNSIVAGANPEVLAALIGGVAGWGMASAARQVHAHVIDPDDAIDAMWRAVGANRTGLRTRLVRTIEPGEEVPAVILPAGVHIVAACEHPELEPQLDAVWQATHRDIPSALPFNVGDDFTIRRELDLDAADPLPPGLHAAVGPGGEVIGLGLLVERDPATGAWSHRMTGVDRAWRGRGIARALKQHQVAWAASTGVAQLRASNDEGNVGMRRINDQLGYVATQSIAIFRAPLPR